MNTSAIKQINAYYCKALKKTGTPLINQYIWKDGTIETQATDHLVVRGEYIEKIEMVYNNATGKAKRSGATTMLKVFMK